MLQPMAREVLARILPVAPTGAWVTREYTLPLHEGQIALDIEAFAKAHAETRIGIYPSAASFRREVTVRLGCAQQHPGLAALLRIPENRMITGAMMVGYPKHRYRRLPERDPLQVTWHAEGSSGLPE